MESYFAKQPIFDLNNKIVAYELLYRKMPYPDIYSGNDGDQSTAEVIVNTFFSNDLLQVVDGKKLFINFTENLILNKTAYLLPKETIIIEILETVSPTDEVLESCRDLKSKDYIIALDDYVYTDETAPLIEIADIVKIDFLNTKKEDILRTANICAKLSITILAEKIETKESLDLAHSLGAKYIQGFYFAKPILIKNTITMPMKHTFNKLMDKYNKNTMTIETISEIIEQDAVMTVNLLRYVNTVIDNSRKKYVGKISSVHQAISTIGLKRSKEFIYLMSLQKLDSPVPENLVLLAFFRARFCESLADYVNCPNINRKELYLMGLVSLIPKQEVYLSDSNAEELPVSDNIKKGLSGEPNDVYADIFKLVTSYEKAQWDEISVFNEKYGTTDSILSENYIECLRATDTLINSCLHI
ncbi:MAG: HDOD domain-containing protein [Clostridiales bacterium]|nr:HDOD domain-containing protein [Clostridiales bacterium]